MSTTTNCVVESLVDRCQHYIAMHLEEFPASHLSLLPLKTREALLWRLPVADVCLLEDTDFNNGIQDMAEYWKHPYGDFTRTQEDPYDFDVACYFEQWDEVDYSKAILYGQVATAVIGCLREDFAFNLPFGDDIVGENDIITLLYTVRRPIVAGDCVCGDCVCGCETVFPPRYHRYLEQGQFTKQQIIAAVTRCFRGELPKILADVQLYDGVELDNGAFLSNVTYIGIHGTPFEGDGLDFIKAVISGSSHLEVLILEGVFCQGEVSIDNFCSHLISCLPFLPNFRLLKLLSCEQTYVVSRNVFDKLVTIYYSTTTDHLQKLRFIDTKITAEDMNNSNPLIDQRYLDFKVIELKDCMFISNLKTTRKMIHQWLGQDICALHTDEENAACCIFKVKKMTPGLFRKRRHSEIDVES